MDWKLIGKIGMLCGLVLTLIGIVTAFGYQPEAPVVWRSEFKAEQHERKVIGQVASSARLVYLYRRRNNLQFTIRKYIKQRLRVPQDMKDELRQLNNEIRRITEIQQRNQTR